MVVSRLPNVACVMKAELINNPIYGAQRAWPAIYATTSSSEA